MGPRVDPVDDQGKLLLRLMSASTLRARAIAGNLSNLNTPGYLRREVRFEELLGKELRGGADLGRLARVAPELVQDELSPRSPDGNNVSMELEMNALRENQLLYDMYAAMLAGRTKLIEISLGRSS
jgi:flagellar basal-body rod protein FlgB